jgi:hypothetical protein
VCNEYLRGKGVFPGALERPVAWGSEEEAMKRETVKDEFQSLQAFHAAVIASVMGDPVGLNALIVQSVLGPLNRKLAVATFLGSLTEDKIGSFKKPFLSEEDVRTWIRVAKTISLKDRTREVLEVLGTRVQ